MRVRLVIPGLLAMWVAGSAACGRNGVPLDEVTSAPRPGPIPFAPPPEDAGDGHDGPLVAGTSLVINTCEPVTLGSADLVAIGAADAAFVSGRRVLVWQVQDDVVTASGDTADLVSFGDAGRWQIVRISSVVGTALEIAPLLAGGAYDSTGTRRAQACTVPEFTSVHVATGGAIVADQWNGSTGGVIALFANESLTVDGAIEANQRGFRGGVRSGGQAVFDVIAMDTIGAQGGGKGEGIDGRGYALFGRGNYANGGGGGNALNSGGGGGANGGAGGRGGRQRVGGTSTETTGRPGARNNAHVEQRLLAGGGGGAGHYNQVVSARGGDGGGVVLVFARDLGGAGVLAARGGRGEDGGDGSDGTDGGGGGGAGGTIYVRVNEPSSFAGRVVLAGGSGGNVSQATGPDRGPGGGGGGGVLRADGIAFEDVQLEGGAPGIVSNTLSNHFATAGSAGRIDVIAD